MSRPMISGHDDVQDVLSRPLRDVAIEEVTQLLLRAAKEPSSWMIGLELELFGLRRDGWSPAGYTEITRVLESLGQRAQMAADLEEGSVVGLRARGATISLEPGGQIELATRPHRELKALRGEVSSYAADLKRVGDAQGIGFSTLGYHPFEGPGTMPRMPKERYAIMRSYFGARGARALEMMYCTASVQCAVDSRDERNMTDKIRTAARISPFLSALVASSPFARGRLNGFKTIRYQVWLETDEERCGLWPEMLDQEGLTFRRYVERALRAPVLFFIKEGRYERAEHRPLAHYVQQGFQGRDITIKDLVDHLTTFFPEIRPKGYVELRGADCLPPEEAVALAGVWRGILDDEGARREVDDRLAVMTFERLRALQPEVARVGLASTSAAGPVAEVVEWLVRLAHERLEASSRDCAECVEPLVERALRRRSPADDLVALAEARSVEEAVASSLV